MPQADATDVEYLNGAITDERTPLAREVSHEMRVLEEVQVALVEGTGFDELLATKQEARGAYTMDKKAPRWVGQVAIHAVPMYAPS